DQGPRGEHAVVGGVRASTARVPGQRDPGGRDGAGGGGAGVHVRLAAVRRGDGGRGRDEDVRRFGAAQGVAEEVRIHRGGGRRRGESATRRPEKVTAPASAPKGRHR